MRGLHEVLVLFILLSLCVQATNSVNAQNNGSKNSTTLAVNISILPSDSLLNMASGIANNYPDSAKMLYQEILGRNDIDPSTQAYALKGIGIIYQRKANYGEALQQHQNALEIFEKIQDSSGIASTFNQIGHAYWEKGSFDIAMENFLKALEISEAINNKSEVSYALNNIGNIYLSQEFYDKAEEFYQKALKIRKELGDEREVANSINNLGIVYWYKYDYEKAMEYYLQLIELSEKFNDKHKQSYAYTNIALLYSDMELYDSAFTYYYKSYEIDKEMGNRSGMAIIEGNIAKTLIAMNKYEEALSYALQSLETANEIDDLNRQSYASNLLYIIYKNLNDLENALKYHVLFKSINDSILKEETSEVLQELKVKYESETKEKENEILRKDNQINQLIIDEQINLRNIMILVLFFVVVILLIVYNRSRIKTKANRELARKNALITDQKEQISSALKNLESLNQQLNQQKNELHERAVELKAANATKDKFFSIIAHDLINPFNAILGFSEILLESYDNQSEDERKNLLENLRKSSVNTFNLLTDLLSWARTQDGKLKLKIEEINLHNLIEYCTEAHRQSAHKKNIKIKTNNPSNLSISIDKNTICSALSNLIGNAVKFTEPGGEISVELEEAEGNFIIHVKDNGVGIEAEKLEKLFNINENNSTPGTNNESGTGLGLTLAREFVEANNGSIKVKSQPGVGSDFMIILQKT